MKRQAAEGKDGDEADDEADLNAEDFFADMVGLLAENLEETIGLEDSAAFVSAVGGQMGRKISASYPVRVRVAATEMDEARRKDVAEAIARICVNLKARIGGDFDIESIEDGRVILTNRRCPFGERVRGRPSLCMMTTNVFGRVAADRNGYASVHVDKAIAAGDAGCRVVINLDRDEHSEGHEFFD